MWPFLNSVVQELPKPCQKLYLYLVGFVYWGQWTSYFLLEDIAWEYLGVPSCPHCGLVRVRRSGHGGGEGMSPCAGLAPQLHIARALKGQGSLKPLKREGPEKVFLGVLKQHRIAHVQRRVVWFGHIVRWGL